MTNTARVAAHRERLKAEGIKTVSITMTADTHKVLKDIKETTGKTYQQIIEEALLLISGDREEYKDGTP